MIRNLIAFAFAASLAIPSTATAAQAPSAAETYGRAVVDACSSGDAPKMIALMNAAYGPKALAAASPAERITARFPLCKATGGWVLKAVKTQTPQMFEAVYTARDLPAMTAQSHVAVDADGKVIQDRFSVVLPFNHLAAQTDAQIAATLDMWFQGAARNNAFGGVAYLEGNGKVLLSKSYEAPQYPGAARDGAATRFPIASMAKMFTAVSIAQLVESGKLRYDETLAQALPTYHGAGAAAITIAQLLSHTAGTGDMFTPAYDAFTGDLPDNDSNIRFFEHDPLLFAPGASWHYSNAGFVLLGAIIERASGMPFYSYVESHVFIPAGMTHTAYDPLGIDRSSDAVAYKHDVKGLRHADGGLEFDESQLLRPLVRYSEKRIVRGTAAGNAYSTVQDLAAFAHALLGGKLLTRASVDLLFTPHGQSAEIAPDAYGYGFELTNRNGHFIPGHNGGTEYIIAGLRIIKDGTYIFVGYNALGGTSNAVSIAAPVEYLQALLTQ
jgi:CubicO group peptidase (beta-lactamase class C family)